MASSFVNTQVSFRMDFQHPNNPTSTDSWRLRQAQTTMPRDQFHVPTDMQPIFFHWVAKTALSDGQTNLSAGDEFLTDIVMVARLTTSGPNLILTTKLVTWANFHPTDPNYDPDWNAGNVSPIAAAVPISAYKSGVLDTTSVSATLMKMVVQAVVDSDDANFAQLIRAASLNIANGWEATAEHEQASLKHMALEVMWYPNHLPQGFSASESLSFTNNVVGITGTPQYIYNRYWFSFPVGVTIITGAAFPS